MDYPQEDQYDRQTYAASPRLHSAWLFSCECGTRGKRKERTQGSARNTEDLHWICAGSGYQLWATNYRGDARLCG